MHSVWYWYTFSCYSRNSFVYRTVNVASHVVGILAALVVCVIAVLLAFNYSKHVGVVFSLRKLLVKWQMR